MNAKSSVGNTALTYACCGGYEDVVKILLDAGADVEHQNENGHTPLMEAASCGHVGKCSNFFMSLDSLRYVTIAVATNWQHYKRRCT